jgi:hypothetical protein
MDRWFGQRPIVPKEHLTEYQKVSMLAQPAAERRFLLERMPAAIARTVDEGRPVICANSLLHVHSFPGQNKHDNRCFFLPNERPRLE